MPFNTNMKYGIDERGMYADPTFDVNNLVAFLKNELDDKQAQTAPVQTPPAQTSSSGQQANVPVLPAPGANTVPSNIPFNVPNVLPQRSAGYTHALKDILKRFGTKLV